jgi:exodeoxyribonuclease (lambda-induced)
MQWRKTVGVVSKNKKLIDNFTATAYPIYEVVMMEQRTPEWYQARIGKITCSRLSDVIPSKKKSSMTEKMFSYMSELIAERATGTYKEIPPSPAMQWGIDHEDEAKFIFEKTTGLKIKNFGFINHPLMEYFGGSPDGITDDDHIIELKCPNTVTHLNFFYSGDTSGYWPQIGGNAEINNLKKAYLVSFDPRVDNKKLQLFIQELEVTDSYRSFLIESIKTFWEGLIFAEKRINQRSGEIFTIEKMERFSK